METRTKTSLRLSRIIAASPEDVFDAWTRPELIRKWSCPAGAAVIDSEVDLTVGGAYRLQMQGDDGSVHTAVGRYVRIEEPSLLVYTWDWLEHPVGETLVTVRFSGRDGSTEVEIVHERFPDDEAVRSHEEGWSSCLDRLEELFA